MPNIYPADLVDDVEDRDELRGMGLYLQTRFFPPLPATYAPIALAALRLCNLDDADATIILPHDLNPLPRTAGRTAEGIPTVIAGDLVGVLRLWDHVDTDEEA